MKRFINLSVILFISCMVTACCTVKKTGHEAGRQDVLIPGPKAVIYKTTKDYSKLVPVNLSDDKKSVASYPDVKDVYFNGTLAYPTPLHDGFLLDNRGITRNVAFLKLTYEEYSQLPKTPSAGELLKMILDPDPLSVMYVYSRQAVRENLVNEINAKIDAGNFAEFTRLK
jgi:hypothetical protein